MVLIKPLLDTTVHITVFGMLNPPRIWGGLFILLCLLYIVQSKFRFDQTKFIFYMAGFILFATIPVFLSQDLLYGMLRHTKILVWCLGIFVFYDMFRAVEVREKYMSYIPMISFFLIGAFVLGYILYNYFGIQIRPDGDVYSYERQNAGFKSFFDSSTSLAYSCFFMIIALNIRFVFDNMPRSVFVIISLLLVFLILISLNRTAILGTLVFYVLLYQNKKLLLIFMLTAIVAFVAYSAGDDVLQHRVYREFDTITDAESQEDFYDLGSGRVGFAVSSLTYFWESHPLYKFLGLGLDADTLATEKFYHKRAAHNDFVQVLVNYGLICFVFFLLFLTALKRQVYSIDFVLIRQGISVRNLLRAAFWSVVSLMFFQDISNYPSMLFFVANGMYLYWQLKDLKMQRQSNQLVESHPVTASYT